MRALCFIGLFGLTALTAFGCGGKSSPDAPEMPSEMRSMSGGSSAGASFSSSTALPGKYGPRAMYNGKEVSTIQAEKVDGGLTLPDGNGGVVWIPGEPVQKPQPGYQDARELKLTAKNLAEQLLAGMNASGCVALPVSFVNMDNLEQTSSFGRLMAEQMTYEFNQRGFAVREYHAPRHIEMRDGEGDFYLTRALGNVDLPAGSVVVAGTYYADKQAVIVNARLIRPMDGRVLRTANAILPASTMTKRMTAGSGMNLGGGSSLKGGGLCFRDFKEATQPKPPAGAIDQGADIH